MTKMTFKQSSIALLTCLTLILGDAFAQEETTEIKELTNLVGSIDIPEGLTEEQVVTVIIKTSTKRKWNVVSSDGDQVVLNLIHRGYDSTLTLQYSTNSVKIYSDSWKIRKSGKKKSRKDPMVWIENLKKDLEVYLNREAYQI